MKVLCSQCNVTFKLDMDGQFFFLMASRPVKRDFLASVICDVCSNKRAPRVTAAGSLACHVPHISDKKTENVSRETIENGGKGE